MTGSTTRSQGRARRPWEPWHLAIFLLPAVAFCAIVLGFLVAVALHRVANGVLVIVFGFAVVVVAWLYHSIVAERVSVWRCLDGAIVVHDPHWRAALPPRLLQTSRGMVIDVRPPPMLDPVTLERALTAVALHCGLQLVSWRVVPMSPPGHLRLRSTLHIEMAR